jgi:hypothetical protein
MHKALARRVVARYLQAAPLDDYYSMPTQASPKTVGWGREKDPHFLAAATSFFQTRKDSWAIIVQPEEASKDDVRAYVEGNPKLKRSKIIVVTSESMDGDYNTSKWVVIHDIVGHSISNETFEPEDRFDRIAFHKALPTKYRISIPNADDMRPDILAAIFFHADLKDFVAKAAEIRLEFGDYPPYWDLVRMTARMQKIYEEMVVDVARWTSGFKLGKPRFLTQW